VLALVADDGHCADDKQPPQISIALLVMLPSLSLPPVPCCFGTNPIQAARLRPDEKLFQSPISATNVVAPIGPMPGISASRRLASQARWAREKRHLPSHGRPLETDCRKAMTFFLSSVDARPLYGFMLLPGTTSSGLAMKCSSFSSSQTKPAGFIALE
jgi:hypothetical protein